MEGECPGGVVVVDIPLALQRKRNNHAASRSTEHPRTYPSSGQLPGTDQSREKEVRPEGVEGGRNVDDRRSAGAASLVTLAPAKPLPPAFTEYIVLYLTIQSVVNSGLVWPFKQYLFGSFSWETFRLLLYGHDHRGL